VQSASKFCFVHAERVGFIAVISRLAARHRSAAQGPVLPISHCPAQSIGYAVIDGQDKQESYEIY